MKQELEIAHLKLKMQEEELELCTQLTLSDAKCKLYERVGNASTTPISHVPVSTMSDINVTNVQSVIASGTRLHKTYQCNNDNLVNKINVNSNQGKVELDPAVEIFTTSLSNHISSEHIVDDTAGNVHIYRSQNTNNVLSGFNEFTPEDALTSVVKHLKKPTPGLKSFSGDAMEYRTFMRQFNSKVFLNADSDNERLY